MNPLAALYRRVSTDQQDNSLIVQEALNDEYCRRLEFQVSDLTSFADEDISGGTPFRERPGGRLLLARLGAGDIRHFVTSKQDRVGRDTVDTITTIRTIWNLGILPHFTAEGGAFPRTSQNEMLLEIKASVAQYERNLIKERTKAILNHKFNQYQLTGNVPFGWDCSYEFADGTVFLRGQVFPAIELGNLTRQHGACVKRLVPNPAEQRVIFYIAQAVANGCKREHVALDLNRQGFRTKLGRAWQIGHVTSVLNNRYSRRLLAASKPEGEDGLAQQTTTYDESPEAAIVPPVPGTLALLSAQPAHP